MGENIIDVKGFQLEQEVANGHVNVHGQEDYTPTVSAIDTYHSLISANHGYFIPVHKHEYTTFAPLKFPIDGYRGMIKLKQYPNCPILVNMECYRVIIHRTCYQLNHGRWENISGILPWPANGRRPQDSFPHMRVDRMQTIQVKFKGNEVAAYQRYGNMYPSEDGRKAIQIIADNCEDGSVDVYFNTPIKDDRVSLEDQARLIPKKKFRELIKKLRGKMVQVHLNKIAYKKIDEHILVFENGNFEFPACIGMLFDKRDQHEIRMHREMVLQNEREFEEMMARINRNYAT